MSVELVKQAMLRFLADPTPEVLCIKGKWGTGKTHAWDDAVKTAKADKTMALKTYAYVSLFGIDNSSDIMQNVYVNTDYRQDKKLNFLFKKMKQVGRVITDHAAVPYISGLGGVARAVLANSVSDTVICIDDFERKGANVTVNEIMGTIAQLRDARQCKVVLILNEDSLKPEELGKFNLYSEKVIDFSLQFEPTPVESAAIAFPKENDQLSNNLRQACEQLGITNIRVMHKIGFFAIRIIELLKDVDQEIVQRVIRSLVVIAWSIITPKGEGAPDFEFISNRNYLHFFANDKAQPTTEEFGWDSVLTRYNFDYFDDFGKILAKGVEQGYFNDADILSGANKYLMDAQKARANAAFLAAWDPFDDSFDDNAGDVALEIYKRYVENITYLSAQNLSHAVSFLKDIGFPKYSSDLLKSFIDSRDDKYNFDLSSDPFGSHVPDPDVISEFAKRLADVKKFLPTPIEAATNIYNTKGGSPEDEESLANLSVDDLVAIFKNKKGDDLSIIIRGSLFFRQISNATERQRKITDAAQAALKKIGNESQLNAHRIKRFNIEFEPSEPLA
ncbi:MAG: hypothetical protein KGQ46_10370 [Hyphomicrobiales bacterium]|nr:hypothetical protein [Hyphomicrobiales bacterium]